ncbi:hypothetical protein A9G19_06095 [Gilliamella apis]|nr:hypothetical protein A9G19_06095 [Gilliamella apis]
MFFLLFITGIALIAIYHRSILIYWQQTYHSDLFNSGGVTQDFIKEDSDEAIDEILLGSQATIIDHDDNVEDTNIHLIKDILIIPQPDIVKKNQTNKPENNQASLLTDLETPKIPKHDIPLIHEPLPIVLTENDKVFFAGDSLMQGVAPYVKKMLFKQYKIESIDLSKQSTGLAYPKAFNWPKTISDNLITDPSIKLLVVFLGPNDPWDFPVKGYPKYVKFKSPIWEEEYRLRIAAILNSAYEHDVQVLWLAAPCMRKPKLNDGMVYLNMLYQSEIEKVQQHFLTTNQLLGCTYENFTSFVESDKGKIKVRVDDGVHFTSTGQKILATAIMEKIIFKQLEDNDSD